MSKDIPTSYSDVVIIGAGISGINMACQLQRQLGVHDYVIYERAQELGGAWAANQYPGCGVDIPGALYSLSWFPNFNFSKVFPPQSEILSYIQRVAQAFSVEKHIKFGQIWTGAKWDEERHVWHVSLRDVKSGMETVRETKVLISAVGAYSNPKFPHMPGLDNFKGPMVHTAQWDKRFDLKGLRVGVIGNGCSASQVVPAIASDARSVTQFTRRPQHYLPMPLSNAKIGRLSQKVMAWVPFLFMLARWIVFWVLDSAIIQFYEDSSGQRMRDESLKRSQEYVMKSAPASYLSMLSPDYAFGCRRRILDAGYLRSLHRNNVELIQDTIVSSGPGHVMTASGTRYDVDFMILATGFEFTQWQGEKVIGRNGVSLKQHWDDIGGIEAYRTVSLNDFPNYFYLLGPNSGNGHTSVLFAMDVANMVVKIIRPVLQRSSRSVEVKRTAELEWCTEIQSALKKTVLASGCSNQFSEPSTGWNFFSYPFSSFRFWAGTRFPNMSHWVYH
ncbi:flavin-binding monooxygenase-like domain-containing protein [Sarocladium implicatum]|nr:flavin-binding monooxygenase-like domain-containing protein [Sarocladium implicatum]